MKQYYRAVATRDPKYDGKFFVGVKTTGVYCRPICPARPKPQNIEFFKTRLGAEKAGYRACLRCRPETAPRSAAWIGKSAVVKRAVKKLNEKGLPGNEDTFAESFGVTARHLRRLFKGETGKTPKQLSMESRLLLARKLVTESSQPISEAALVAGFKSVRRFNDAFKQRFKKSPTQIRRSKGNFAHG
jgi:AraC family transcriptional regulator of adaptative response / DNA-3-methyladenine glycosylase II